MGAGRQIRLVSSEGAVPRTTARNLLVVGLLVSWSLWVLPWNLESLSSWDGLAKAWGRLLTYLRDFASPDLSSAMLLRCGGLAMETVAVAVLGTAFGLCLGYPLAVLAARSVWLTDAHGSRAATVARRVVVESARLVLDGLRGVPDFLWAVVFAGITGVNAGTGVLALGLSVAGILGKVLSEQWDNVDEGRYRALRSTGASPLQVFLYGVQPLAARSVQSFVLMRLECAVRNASVIGVVGGGGLGAALWDEYTDGSWSRVATVLLSLLLVTVCTDLLANLARRQLRVDPNHPRTRGIVTPASARRRRLCVLMGVAVLVLASVWILAAPLGRAWQELDRIDLGWLSGFLGSLAVPDLHDDTLFAVARHSAVPLAIAVLATLSGAVLAGVLSYPGSVAFQLEAYRFTGERIGWPVRMLRWCFLVFARALAVLLRGIPEVAWVVLLMVFFKQGVTPCVLAVALHTAGVLHRVFTETLDNVPYGQLERVTNARRPQIFLYGALPRALPDWRTYLFFQFEVNVRIGIALGIVGAGGLGERFKNNLDFAQYAVASSFLWAMLLLTVAIDRLSRWLQLRRSRC
jgi:phosphonate transport system permease protein